MSRFESFKTIFADFDNNDALNLFKALVYDSYLKIVNINNLTQLLLLWRNPKKTGKKTFARAKYAITTNSSLKLVLLEINGRLVTSKLIYFGQSD